MQNKAPILRKRKKDYSFFIYAQSLINNLKYIKKNRLSETYASSVNSLKLFMKGKDLKFQHFSSTLMQQYEQYLLELGLVRNSSSFYLRNLRAIYNRAVYEGICEQSLPFHNVYTGIDNTMKRAISYDILCMMRHLDLASDNKLAFARDMFLFSLYTRGMSFVDMAFLRKSDLKNNLQLIYRRQKTKQTLVIGWEPCMHTIVERYNDPDSPFLLPIISLNKPTSLRRQYLSKSHLVNRHLKLISEQIKSPIPITMYVARHSWANLARSQNIPIAIISQSMGHNSERTTQIYLDSINNAMLDKANHLILDSILQG